jgi:hypothetical protein
MTKFEIGDRVKCTHPDQVNAGVVGQVYSVTDIDIRGFITIDPQTGGEHTHCYPDRFELYAKAGEFVMGDRVVNVHDSRAQVRTVKDVAPGTAPGLTNLSVLILEDDNMYAAKGFRLATPEEIAASVAKYLEPETLAKWVHKVYGTPRPTHYVSPPTEPQEIPAAKFDFNAIKKGDVVVFRHVVADDGLFGGQMAVEYEGGRRYIEHEEAAFVIPAPKPKTLRERAIEAVQGVTNSGRLGTGDILAIVDAVLTEVEKGR